jgi:hypothetical protein
MLTVSPTSKPASSALRLSMTSSSSASGACPPSTSVNGLSSSTVTQLPANVGGPNPGSPIGSPSLSMIWP